MQSSHFERLWALASSVASAPPGLGRKCGALVAGFAVHLAFAAGVGAMILAMFFGMSESFGTVAWPYAAAVNALLIVQFPAVHSFLLSKRGGAILTRLIPGGYGGTLSTSTYAFVASIQLLALFVLWTPTGIIWWRAEGWAFYVITGAYVCAWLLVAKSTWDAGIEVQSGALGWLSMLAKKKPVFPSMPTTGLFRIIRQPIYVSFALTLWTVPVWTPDQLALAISWTAYCLVAPLFKERRFTKRYGDQFQTYKKSVPYAVPLGRTKDDEQ